MDVVKNPDGTVYEIVGESGTPDGEGCLSDIASVGTALMLLAAALGGLVWALS